MHAVGEQVAHQPGGVEAEQVGRRLRGEADPQVAVEDDDRVDAALHQGAEGGLAVVQGAGEPALPAVDSSWTARNATSAAAPMLAPRRAVEPDGQQAAEHPATAPTRGHREEPGASPAGRARACSRGLPQEGGGGHDAGDRDRSGGLQSSLPVRHPSGWTGGGGSRARTCVVTRAVSCWPPSSCGSGGPDDVPMLQPQLGVSAEDRCAAIAVLWFLATYCDGARPRRHLPRATALRGSC